MLVPAWSGVLDVFLPASCEACNRSLEVGARVLCARCAGSIRWLGSRGCFRCGGPRSELLTRRRCRRCRGRRFAFRWLVAGAVYDAAVRKLVLRLKYGPEPRLARTLARLVAPQLEPVVRARRVHALVPVPLHASRQRLRGFNQADLLARELGPLLGLPVWRSVVRTAATEAQAGLPGSTRRTNVGNAFAPRRLLVGRVRGARVALVDDVVATGSTLTACAEVLERLGAAQVGAVVVAAAAPD